MRLVNYDPEQQDALAKIVRGELPLKQIGKIANPDYEPPAESVVSPDPEPVDIIESELQLEEQPTAADAEEAVRPGSEIEQTEEIPLDEIRSLETEPEESAGLSEPRVRSNSYLMDLNLQMYLRRKRPMILATSSPQQTGR